MGAIVTMALDEVKKMPPLSDEKLREIREFTDESDDEDCPILTKEQLKEFRPWYEVHPEGNSTYKNLCQPSPGQ